MKTTILLVALFIACVAAFPKPAEVPEIETFENDADDRERYKFAFKSSDGIEREETAEIQIKEDRFDDTSIADTIVRGSYSFVADDGQLYTVRYSASAATGFVVEGDHIPKA